MKIIVSDTTALIILAKSKNLYLLKNLFETIYIPEAVFSEINYKQDKVSQEINNQNFIEVKKITNKTLFKEIEAFRLDIGESEAITLALELNLNLIIDEKKGRKIAKLKSIKHTGILGILKVNYDYKFINSKEILEIYNECKEAGMRINKQLESSFLSDIE